MFWFMVTTSQHHLINEKKKQGTVKDRLQTVSKTTIQKWKDFGCENVTDCDSDPYLFQLG